MIKPQTVVETRGARATIRQGEISRLYSKHQSLMSLKARSLSAYLRSGVPVEVDGIVHQLHILKFAEQGEWSRRLPSPVRA